jgi:PAS domain S-box-containing protein
MADAAHAEPEWRPENRRHKREGTTPEPTDLNGEPQALAALAEMLSALRQSIQALPCTTRGQLALLERLVESATAELATADAELTRRRRRMSGMARELEFERLRYQEMFELAPDAYIVTTIDGQILEANRAAHELVNMPEPTLQGLSLGAYLVSRSERPIVTQEIDQLAAVHAGRREWFGRLHRRGDTSRDVAVAVTAVRAPGTDAVLGARWLVRDVTAWIRAETEVRRLNVGLERRVAERTAELEERTRQLDQRTMEAEAANRAKAQFLAAMSHEIRTPLNAVAGYADLLEMAIHGPLSERQHDFIQRIRRANVHLLGLLNDVLNFSRLESSRVRFATEAVPFDDVLETAHGMIDPQAHERDVYITRCAPGAGIVADADHEKVLQIVLNLATNAIKFTPSGGRLTLSCGNAVDGVWIEVSDTGPGIPADRLDQIFEPFVQLGRSNTGMGHGVGLGLAISRDLARGMHGNLTAESVVGAGSTFRLTLPAHAV